MRSTGARAFLAAFPAPGGSEDELARTVDVIIAAGREAWPGIPIDEEAFATWLAGHGTVPNEGLADDLYLAFACAEQNEDALRAFEQRYFGDVDQAVAGLHLPVQPDEVKQILRIKLFSDRGEGRPFIRDYAGRGGLRAWFRVTAVRVTLNLRRSTRRETAMPDAFEQTAAFATSDPELAHLRARHRSDFTAALSAAITELSADERNFLRHRYIDGLSVDVIGAMYRIHRATAARKVERARAALVEKTRALLRERLRATTTELDSLLRLVDASVDVDLANLLDKS